MMEYVNEDLWPGYLGNFLIVLSFASALLAAYAYFKSASQGLNPGSNWRILGRRSFQVHAVSTLGAIFLLFGLLVTHQFEYYYVWFHSSEQLPFRYMFSSFWEGQEGSFMLWMFWHVILGLILLRSSGQWESPVMVPFALVQAFIGSMLLGIYIGDFRIGTTPFLLLREHPDMLNLPFLQNEHYLAHIEGRGLNPLLQNYWMTIHPPTLFLGFAATLVPFAYAAAGLWQRRYNEWLKPAIPWTFFAVMVLGTGILMGGAWAYEALSFGGFWAWDPVENASLVPWLTLVGAAHIMLIRNAKGGSLLSAFLLTMASFLLVLYSTFLTRSGILGETSVHAFTGEDRDWHLLSILILLLGWSIYLIVSRKKEIPASEKEEHLWSREFWMFIGALVLMISAFQIIVYTSIPVYNQVFGTNIAPPNDPIEVYNSWQIPFAVIVTLLIGVGQFFKYKRTDMKKFVRTMVTSFFISLGLSILIVVLSGMTQANHMVLLFTALFAFTANLDYLFRILKGKIRLAGGSIAHAGFALIIGGALISTSQSKVISQNTSGIDVRNMGESINNQEYIMLMKGDTVPMDEYLVTYTGKRREGVHYMFRVEYLRKSDGKLFTDFYLEPIIQINPRMGNVAEPDTRHFLHKDIYTHIASTDMALLRDDYDPEQYGEERTSEIHIGDTINFSGSMAVLHDVSSITERDELKLGEQDIAAAANFTIIKRDGTRFPAEAVFVIRNNSIRPIPLTVDEAGLELHFAGIDPDSGKVTIQSREKLGNSSDFIVLKAIVFPGINILWLGCILLIIGTVIALRSRMKRK